MGLAVLGVICVTAYLRSPQPLTTAAQSLLPAAELGIALLRAVHSPIYCTANSVTLRFTVYLSSFIYLE